MKIKNIFVGLIMLVCIVSSLLFVQSCSSEDYDKEYITDSSTNEMDAASIEKKNAEIAALGWEKQLLLAMKRQNESINKMGLTLEGYHYEGVLDKQIVKKNILDLNSLFPVYDTINSFKLLSINEMSSIEGSTSMNKRIAFLEKQLDSIYNAGVEIVKLDWSYKNNKFSTIALVSDQKGGVIYDNILSNIVITEFFRTETRNDNSTNYSPRLKSATEQGGGSCTYTKVIDGVHRGGLITTYAWVQISGTITGEKNSISEFKGSVTSGAQENWSAGGSIQEKKLVRGLNGYVDLIYVFYTAKDATCTITGGVSVGGFSVSISKKSGESWAESTTGSQNFSSSLLK